MFVQHDNALALFIRLDLLDRFMVSFYVLSKELFIYKSIAVC